MGLQKVNGCCIANSMDGQCVVSPTEKEDPCKEMIEVMDALVAAEKKYKFPHLACQQVACAKAG